MCPSGALSLSAWVSLKYFLINLMSCSPVKKSGSVIVNFLDNIVREPSRKPLQASSETDLNQSIPIDTRRDRKRIPRARRRSQFMRANSRSVKNGVSPANTTAVGYSHPACFQTKIPMSHHGPGDKRDPQSKSAKQKRPGQSALEWDAETDERRYRGHFEDPHSAGD